MGAPVVAAAIWEYIKSKRTKPAEGETKSKDTVRFALLVERVTNDERTVVKLEYDGPAENAESVMSPIVARVAKGELPERTESEANPNDNEPE